MLYRNTLNYMCQIDTVIVKLFYKRKKLRNKFYRNITYYIYLQLNYFWRSNEIWKQLTYKPRNIMEYNGKWSKLTNTHTYNFLSKSNSRYQILMIRYRIIITNTQNRNKINICPARELNPQSSSLVELQHNYTRTIVVLRKFNLFCLKPTHK